MESAFSDPIHAILYMSFMVRSDTFSLSRHMNMILVCYQILSCGGLSYMWIGVSGSGAVEEANKITAQGMCILKARAVGKGQVRPTVAAPNFFSDARFCFLLQKPVHTIKTLNKYIPMAALLGGMAIGELLSLPRCPGRDCSVLVLADSNFLRCSHHRRRLHGRHRQRHRLVAGRHHYLRVRAPTLPPPTFLNCCTGTMNKFTPKLETTSPRCGLSKCWSSAPSAATPTPSIPPRCTARISVFCRIKIWTFVFVRRGEHDVASLGRRRITRPPPLAPHRASILFCIHSCTSAAAPRHC